MQQLKHNPLPSPPYLSSPPLPPHHSLRCNQQAWGTGSVKSISFEGSLSAPFFTVASTHCVGIRLVCSTIKLLKSTRSRLHYLLLWYPLCFLNSVACCIEDRKAHMIRGYQPNVILPSNLLLQELRRSFLTLRRPKCQRWIWRMLQSCKASGLRCFVTRIGRFLTAGP